MTTHEITVVRKLKMDAIDGLYTWKCSCGRHGGVFGFPGHAEIAGNAHKKAKETVT